MKNEYILQNENIRQIVKLLATVEGKTLTRLKVDINHKYNKTDSLENLTNKLRNKTVKVSELLEILDVLEYDLIVRKK
ncbi:MAG: hypothetical protein KH301_07730 [Brachyspira sp.]|nr:hypothetical protein [Brachyspira sp.]